MCLPLNNRFTTLLSKQHTCHPQGSSLLALRGAVQGPIIFVANYWVEGGLGIGFRFGFLQRTSPSSALGRHAIVVPAAGRWLCRTWVL